MHINVPIFREFMDFRLPPFKSLFKKKRTEKKRGRKQRTRETRGKINVGKEKKVVEV